MGVLTSKLILELLDRVSGPARKVSASLTALTAMQAKNSARLAAMQGKLLGAAAAGYGLAKGLASPIRAGAEFQTLLEDIRQKSDVSGEALAELGRKLRAIAAATNQLPTDTIKTFNELLGLGLGGTNDENVTAALKMLPAINRVATAYRATSEDVMRAGQSVFQNMKVPANEIEKAFDIMADAGKEGGFELKDMAREFPALTAAAQALEMKGVRGVAQLSAALEIARKGAATGSEAATATSDLMQKMVAPEAVAKFKKAGIDIRKELKKTQAKGEDVFEMIDRVLKKVTGGDQSKVVDFFGDKEVLKFLRPFWQNIAEYRRIRDKALKADGTVNADYISRIKTADAAMKRFRGSLEDLNISVSKGLMPTFQRLLDEYVNPLSERLGKFAEQNPKLTTGIVGVTGGLIALRIAAIGAKFAFGWLWGGALWVARGALVALGAASAPLTIILGTLGAAAIYAYRNWGEVLKLWQRLKEPWTNLGETISSTWEMIAAPMRTKLAEIVTAVRELPEKVKAAASGMYEAGVALIQQLWEGMKAKVQALLGWVSSIGAKIKSALTGGGAAAPSGPAVDGARAAGGPVQRGKSYLVGERGPELWRAPASGRIIDTAGTVAAIKRQALAGAAQQGGGTVNYNIGGIHVQAAPGQSADAIAEAVERKFSAKLAQLSRGAYSDGVN